MMKRIFFFCISVLLIAGCTTEKLSENLVDFRTAGEFLGGFADKQTRTGLDSNGNMYWHQDDRISVFSSTYNQQYRFNGNTGDDNGSFTKVTNGEFVTGTPLSTNYAVYPYDETTSISATGEITLTLPDTQYYSSESFGYKANTMIAVTNGIDDNFLPFKNLCGYLVVKLYGACTVKHISFHGNNNEIVAGSATVKPVHGSDPSVVLSEDGGKFITLNCGSGIPLGRTPEEATEFWFVIPPITFENGFTITVYNDRLRAIDMKVSSSKSITRNIINTMSAVEAKFEDDITSTEKAFQAISFIHELMHEGGSGVRATPWYSQGGYPTFCLHLAALSDDFVYTFSNIHFLRSAQWIHHRDLEHKYQDVYYYWDFFYRIISKANNILKYIDDSINCPGDDGMRNFVKGQALAYRAFALFQLTQAWGERYNPEIAGSNNQLGVIIRTENFGGNLPRSSVEECYAQINNDLDNAIVCLENIGSVIKPNKSHIDQWVAKGLKARVLLTQGRWDEAAFIAENVINHSGAMLQSDTYSCGPFENQMSDMNNTEWLWGQPHYDYDASMHGSLRAWHSFISNNSTSYNRNSPRAINSLLYKTIPDTDVRKNNWVEDPFSRKKGNVRDNGANDGITLWVPTAIARICPYMSQKWLINDGGVQNTYFDVPYMRLPEIVLIAAEGYAKSNQPAKAQQLVYALGHFRDPNYQKPTETGDALCEKIMWQRRVELWAEAGLRWYDLKRLSMPLDRGPKPREGYNQGGTANGWGTAMKTMPTNLDPEASNFNMYGEQALGEDARYIAAGDKRWQWLIPQQEIDINPYCIQNE